MPSIQDVAVGDTAADREGRVHQAVEVDALQILANQRQTGLVAQVEGNCLMMKSVMGSSPAG